MRTVISESLEFFLFLHKYDVKHDQILIQILKLDKGEQSIDRSFHKYS